MKSRQTQKNLWLLAAIAAPAAHFSGCGWLTAGLTALVIGALTFWSKGWGELSRPVGLIQILWLGIVAGSLLPASAVYWPSDNDLAVPLTILVLAAWTNSAAAPRIGAVLAFCMALLAIPQAASGAAHMKLDWLHPARSSWSSGLAVALLLPCLPAVAGERKGRAVFGSVVLATLLAVLVQGVISPAAAAALPDAFYQTARTLGYLEPIAAVWMTLGWYAMTALVLHSVREIARSSGLKQTTANVLAVGTAVGCILFEVQLYGWILPVLSAVLWVLVPILSKINFLQKR